jgi:hypothetical protein
MAHPDHNELKDALLPVAKQMLAEHGEFFPYGAFMKLNGEIVDCSAADEDEHAPSRRLIVILTEDFRRRAVNKEIRAAGICCDVRVARPGETKKSDAVQFALEHENAEALDVFLPYDLDSSGEVIYGELFATHRVKQFFAG